MKTEIIVYPTIRKPEGEGASEINKFVGDETRLAPPLHIIERRGGEDASNAGHTDNYYTQPVFCSSGGITGWGDPLFSCFF